MYLTYAGKGAPKKMISLLDKFVVKMQPYEMSELHSRAKEGFTIPPSVKQYYSNSLYFLKLDFYEQYTIGLMARMIMPVMYRFSHRNIHQYGDKLLVSTLFFMDHLYKFHRHSFSWRALSSSPELIDVNKTPELRNHIMDILHFMTQNDMKTISNGLYDFRFFKMIAQEINFMTRVSEIPSATFDFSLDESLAVKQYYERRLVNQRKIYEADHIKTENTIFELADQHFTLGELYLYDEELDNAIVEFDAAISILQTLEPDKMTPEMIIALIKNMLSLGISYEKQNLNDQAFLVYSEVVKLIVASRNTNIEELGLETYEDNTDKKMKVRPISDLEICKKEPALYFKINSDTEEYSLMELIDKISHLHPTIHKVISKITTYDGLQILYLPLLAKFQILEKSQVGGIQWEDIRRLLKEFYFLVNMVHKKNQALICASFYLKLGNILYYKNAGLIEKENCSNNIWPFCVNINCTYKNECNLKNGEDCCDSKFWGVPINQDALHFYIHCLYLIVYNVNYTKCYSMKSLLQHFKAIKDDNDFNGWDETRFNMLGKVFSCIGDALLADLPADIKEKDEETIPLKDFITNYLALRNKHLSALEAMNKIIEDQYMNDKMVKIGMLYLLSTLFYRKATAYNMSSHMYMKLLTLLKYNASYKCPMEEQGEALLNKVIRNTSSSFKDICFEYQQDINNIFQSAGIISPNKEELEENRTNIYKRFNKHSLLYTECSESIIAYYGILLASIPKSGPYNYENKIIKLYKTFFDSSKYDIYSNIYYRIKLLKFKSEMNYRWLRVIICGKNRILENIDYVTANESFYQSGLKELVQELYKNEKNSIEKLNTLFKNEEIDTCINVDNTEYKNYKEKILFLVRDSLFNLNEVLKFVQIYGETFILTNLFVADTYDKMNCWYKIKELIDRTNAKDEFHELLYKLIGKKQFEQAQECWSWANAARFYYKAQEVHKEGRSYKDIINRACFLNDEFSDQRMHFITARERRKINQDDFKNGTRNTEDDKAKKFFECFNFETNS